LISSAAPVPAKSTTEHIHFCEIIIRSSLGLQRDLPDFRVILSRLHGVAFSFKKMHVFSILKQETSSGKASGDR
jgi:hypothetical protein